MCGAWCLVLMPDDLHPNGIRLAATQLTHVAALCLRRPRSRGPCGAIRLSPTKTALSAPVRLLANRRSSARTVDWPNSSPLAAATGSQISQGFLGQPIQRTRFDILHQLPIPIGNVKTLEPRTELSAFASIQLLHSTFKGLEIAHAATLEWLGWVLPAPPCGEPQGIRSAEIATRSVQMMTSGTRYG